MEVLVPSHSMRQSDVKFFYGLWAILARRFTRISRHFGRRNRKTLPISATVFWHASCEHSLPRFGGLGNRNQTACLEKTTAGI
jgi:hypothetical protein